MPVFAYTAYRNGGRQAGTLVADSAREARDRLRDQGLDLASLRPQSAARSAAPSAAKSNRKPPVSEQGSGGGASLRDARLSLRHVFGGLPSVLSGRLPGVTGFLRELATLVEVGVPVLEALDIIIAQQPRRAGRLKAVLLSVRERVSSGRSLADAMTEIHPVGVRKRTVFDEATVAMVRVGQEVGQLGGVLSRVADYQERRGRMKNRLIGALTYPAMVTLFGLGVCVFLMTNVVPDILEALADSGQAMPWPTRVVKTFSDGLLAYGGWIAVVATGLFMASAAVLSQPRGRAWLDRGLLALPLVGDIVYKQTVVRLAFLLSTLLEAGVSFERAMSIARQSVRNRPLREALDRAEQAVHEGQDLGAAMASTGAFSQTVVKVFDLGQTSGRLGELLSRLAESYDRQVESLTSRLVTFLEPCLIVLLAVLVGLIAFATLLPILEIGNAI